MMSASRTHSSTKSSSGPIVSTLHRNRKSSPIAMPWTTCAYPPQPPSWTEFLLRQFADRDTSPLDPGEVEAEIALHIQENYCRANINEPALRRAAEQTLRLRRAHQRISGEVTPPEPDEVLAFYKGMEAETAGDESVAASHIVAHVNESRGETEARSLMERAQKQLFQGIPFAEVAEAFSDCKGSGGRLDDFQTGEMVQEFEDALASLQPGELSPILGRPSACTSRSCIPARPRSCAMPVMRNGVLRAT